MPLKIHQILDLLLPVTPEIRRCAWKRQHLMIRRQKVAQALEDYDIKKVPIDYEALKVIGLKELIQKQQNISQCSD